MTPDEVRALVADSRFYAWRHATDCTARVEAVFHNPFATPFVDDPRCTCYVLKLYRFETGTEAEVASGGSAAQPPSKDSQEDPQP